MKKLIRLDLRFFGTSETGMSSWQAAEGPYGLYPGEVGYDDDLLRYELKHVESTLREWENRVLKHIESVRNPWIVTNAAHPDGRIQMLSTYLIGSCRRLFKGIPWHVDFGPETRVSSNFGEDVLKEQGMVFSMQNDRRGLEFQASTIETIDAAIHNYIKELNLLGIK